MESPKIKVDVSASVLCGHCWLMSGDPTCVCDGLGDGDPAYEEEQLDLFE